MYTLRIFIHILDRIELSVGIYVLSVRYYSTYANLFIKYANILSLLMQHLSKPCVIHRKIFVCFNVQICLVQYFNNLCYFCMFWFWFSIWGHENKMCHDFGKMFSKQMWLDNCKQLIRNKTCFSMTCTVGFQSILSNYYLSYLDSLYLY